MARKRAPNALPDHPYLLSKTGFVLLTDRHSPFWHFEWIKTNANILKDAFDEIVTMIEYVRTTLGGPPLSGGLRGLLGADYYEDQKRVMAAYAQSLDDHHQIRLVLQRETERYLPELRIPVLRDHTHGWLFPGPLPDRDQFIKEMADIYHEANLRQVKEPEAGIALPDSTPTPNNLIAGKLKKGRPVLTRKRVQDYKRWVKGWHSRRRGEKKQAYCNGVGITVKQLNAALQNIRRKH